MHISFFPISKGHDLPIRSYRNWILHIRISGFYILNKNKFYLRVIVLRHIICACYEYRSSFYYLKQDRNILAYKLKHSIFHRSDKMIKYKFMQFHTFPNKNVSESNYFRFENNLELNYAKHNATFLIFWLTPWMTYNSLALEKK